MNRMRSGIPTQLLLPGGGGSFKSSQYMPSWRIASMNWSNSMGLRTKLLAPKPYPLNRSCSSFEVVRIAITRHDHLIGDVVFLKSAQCKEFVIGIVSRMTFSFMRAHRRNIDSPRGSHFRKIEPGLKPDEIRDCGSPGCRTRANCHLLVCASSERDEQGQKIATFESLRPHEARIPGRSAG